MLRAHLDNLVGVFVFWEIRAEAEGEKRESK